MTSPSSVPLRAALAGLVAMASAMGIGRFVYTPILPGMMDGLGMGASEAGLIASANYLGYLLGAVLAAYGWAAGIERAIVIAGMVATALLLAAMGFFSDVWVLSAVRLAAGVASAFVMIFSSSIVLSHGAVAGRPGVQSVHFGGVGTGMAVSALIVGGLHAAGFGWQSGWFATAAMAAAGLVAVVLLMPAAPVKPADGPVREPPLRWTGPLKAITLAYGIFGFGYIITATFLVAIVRADGGSEAFEMLVWLITGIAAAVSVAAGQPFVRRFGLKTVFVVGCLIEAAGVAASVLVPSPLGPLIGGLLLGGTFVMATAYGLQLGRTLAPKNQRRIFALMTASFGTGQIAGPLVAGYLTEWTGGYTLASLAAALGLLAAALLVGRFTPS